jgi:hypothetical protein
LILTISSQENHTHKKICFQLFTGLKINKSLSSSATLQNSYLNFKLIKYSTMIFVANLLELINFNLFQNLAEIDQKAELSSIPIIVSKSDFHPPLNLHLQPTFHIISYTSLSQY